MVDANPFVEAIEAADELRRQVVVAGWKRRQANAQRRRSDLLLDQLEQLNLAGVKAVPRPLLDQIKGLASQCEVAERPMRWRKVQEALDDLFDLQVTLLRRCYKISDHYASLVEQERGLQDGGGVPEHLATLDAEEEAR
jgi:hypothetical protein